MLDRFLEIFIIKWMNENYHCRFFPLDHKKQIVPVQ